MFIYNTNSTMQMLGKQYVIPLIGEGGIAADDFRNVLDAHRSNKTNDYFNIGVDFFMLGYIYGKRAERSRKKIA